MNKKQTVLLVIGGFILCMLIYGMSVLNSDSVMKNSISAQEGSRQAFFDKLYKVIAQKTEITKASSQLQKELVESLVQGRQSGFIKLIQESNPDSAFSREQFADLSNSVEAQREGFLREQKKLLDLVRENQNIHDRVPSGIILSVFGRQRADDPVIITSDITDGVFDSGKENEIGLGL